VWDTALALIALSDAGVPADHPALARAADWLLGEEVTTSGDWSVARPHLAPGGWAFEFANDNYPDVDDTAEVVLALRRVPDSPRLGGAVQRAARWVQGMQSSGGGWGGVRRREHPRADSRSSLPGLRRGDRRAERRRHGPRAGDARGARADRHAGRPAGSALADRAAGGRRIVVRALGREPRVRDGRGGAGADRRRRRAVRAVHPPRGSLARRAPERGRGLGEDPRSYDEERWIGRGPSTASQTAWALLALHAAGDRSETLQRGVRWLVATQRADGAWDEPQYTGTGFPSDYYINYHLYRLVFPIMALGRCRR